MLRVCESETVEGLGDDVVGVVARGHADRGDKTMVDTLFSAALGAQSTASRTTDISQVLTTASSAATAGMNATRPLVARKGRASYLGERSAGHLDPGAASSALLIHSLADAWRLRAVRCSTEP
ncbi:DAK2 domain-containing protein [Pseudarthrobacter sp. Y6]|uniref:DAK2 domain-containing protein n=1 Tax=Pseudarthrobacter sp. Y6 TaxID=3418422 RepID=UPI003CEC9DA0